MPVAGRRFDSLPVGVSSTQSTSMSRKCDSPVIDGKQPHKSGSHRTHCWREMDSNFRFRARRNQEIQVSRRSSTDLVYGTVARISAEPSAYATHGADRIVAEVNNGGDMVEATIR